ncbi:MAG: endopeptidase La [Mogibacterium sp.]|nr:endopeptidase La [Mogibacterium sp.]
MIIVPVYDVLLAPEATAYFRTEEFKTAAKADPREGEKVILLITREKQKRNDMTAESFYPIGISGDITTVSPDGYIEVRTHERVNIDDIYMNMDHTIQISISRLRDIEDLSFAEAVEHLMAVKDALAEFSAGFEWGETAKAYIESYESMEEAAVALSPWMSLSNEECYKVLEIDSRRERMNELERIIYEFVEIAKVRSDAASSTADDYRKVYKEQAIKRQMELLQQELDEMHPENVSDLRKMEIKIEESGMNDDARAEATKIVNRLKQEGSNSPEYSMLYDYLDFVTSLSWKKEPSIQIDLDKAEEIMEEDHFGLKKVKQRIIQQIAVMNLNCEQSGSILCFVGAPGTGKTSIGQSIARALGREYVRVSLGGVRDEADIRGHRRTYIGAMPGRIMDGIQKSGVSNPVMVLDEVDKLSASYNGDPASALLEVLDPEQNFSFTDHYMNVPYDLSDVFFVCTANTLDTIPEPLLNRMEVIEFNGYTATDKLQIAVRHLLPKAMKQMGIGEDQLIVPEETIRAIIADYTMEGGVRGLKKQLDTLCRVAAVKIARARKAQAAEAREKGADGAAADTGSLAEATPLTVRPEDLREFLDRHPIRHDQILAEKKPGIVTGLAWTRAGGEILFVETLFTKGSGKITVTGQLGDVMKESAQIAVSLVKAMFPDKADVFEKHDLHIHVPEGAVPKDGPSAGITMTTALASLVTGNAVSPEFGMTGEVSLRGVVTAIGGLPEKLMAAMRAGLKTIFIPKDNEQDLDEVADEVKEALEIIPVGTVEEVLLRTGVAIPGAVRA